MKPKKSWKNFDRLLLLAVFALLIFGLVSVSSASAVLSYHRFGNTHYYFLRQLLFVAVAFVAMGFVSRMDYHFWKKWNKTIVFVVLVLLALVLIPSIGFKPGSSARSWFRFGSFFLQPSEFAKLAVIFYFASWFERKKEAEKNFWFGVVPPLLVATLATALIILEPDIGTAAILALITVLVFFAAGVKLKHLGIIFASAAAVFWILVQTAPYRVGRLLTFLDPSLDPRGIGYHINQALLAIGSGGLWGYGLGGSLQKHNYLPEPIGDSIFAVMAEELGFVRILFLVVLFGILVARGLAIAKQAPDKFGYFVATGITVWIGMQAFVNIGALTGLLPLTGLTLPFLSYGGSSLLSVCLAMGVLLNISRQRI